MIFSLHQCPCLSAQLNINAAVVGNSLEVVILSLINQFLTNGATFCNDLAIIQGQLTRKHHAAIIILFTHYLIIGIVHTAQVNLDCISLDIEVLLRGVVIVATSLWVSVAFNHGIVVQADRLVSKLSIILDSLEHHEQGSTNNRDCHIDLKLAPLTELERDPSKDNRHRRADENEGVNQTGQHRQSTLGPRIVCINAQENVS